MEVGVDVVDVQDIKKRLREAFKKKIYTEQEIHYCEKQAHPEQHYAARFAAKEATIKALLSAGHKQPEHKEIEVTHKNNAPNIRCPPHTLKISLSHTKNTAIAMVILE